MGSRIRENPAHTFECFCEIVIPNANERKPWILQKYPDDFNDQEVMKSIPVFACPCDFNETIKNTAIQHFSFVLTSLDSKWTFGYCRYDPNLPTLLVLISSLPWHETFYKILNKIADLINAKQPGLMNMFLESLYNSSVPEPGFNLHLLYAGKEFIVYCPNHLKLPKIPENRNLTEYFNAIDAHNMMIIFASMLHERRILVTSKKLSRLSACVQAANSLIYPMHWQHIYIPVLPKHLVDYLSAPMPFLIGVPYKTFREYLNKDTSEVVILYADENIVKSPFNDLETLPPEIVSTLKRSLKNPNHMLGDGVARAFMKALVQLIGGYRDSLKFNLGQKISFDADAFLQTRPLSVRPFLEKMLHLQIFQQFIEDRLDMLNSGTGFSDEFEFEVNSYEVQSSHNLRAQYKEWVTTMKKEGGAFLKNVKSKTNPAVISAYKNVKDKGKRAYKDIRSKIQDIQKHPSQPDLRFDQSFDKPKSAPSSPTMLRSNHFNSKRISYGHDINSKNEVLDAFNLQNSLSVGGIRRYKMLTVDELSLASDKTPPLDDNSPGIQKLDLDLMGDLRDVIYRRCSISSDNLNSIDAHAIQEEKDVMGFADSFCDPNDVFLPPPIPPPRLKKTPRQSVVSTNICNPPLDILPTLEKEAALKELESLDEVSLFDPLKENNDKVSELLPYISSQTTSDFRVAELKNTIQKLTPSNQGIEQQRAFYPPSPYFPAQVARPNLLASSYPHLVVNHSIVNQPMQQTRLSFDGTTNEVKPPLPPKTKLASSTFFVPCDTLSNDDKKLLDDYGLSSSPIFNKSASELPQSANKTNWTSSNEGNLMDCLDPLQTEAKTITPSPSQSRKDFKVQSSWQKFA